MPPLSVKETSNPRTSNFFFPPRKMRSFSEVISSQLTPRSNFSLEFKDNRLRRGAAKEEKSASNFFWSRGPKLRKEELNVQDSIRNEIDCPMLWEFKNGKWRFYSPILRMCVSSREREKRVRSSAYWQFLTKGLGVGSSGSFLGLFWSSGACDRVGVSSDADLVLASADRKKKGEGIFSLNHLG